MTSAVLADDKTRESMKAGQRPGSWKYEPMRLPERDREHETYLATLKRQEQAEHRATYSADPQAKEKALPDGREQDRLYVERQEAAGVEPIRLNTSFDRQGAVRSLIRQGIDKAPVDEVYGRTERERASLPTKPETPNTRFASHQKRKKSALGLTTFGPAFRVKGGNRKKRKTAA